MTDSRDTPEMNGDDVPPLRLGGEQMEQIERDDDRTPVDWRRIGMALGLVVAAVVAAVFVVNSRHDAKLDEVAASEIDLVAGSARDRAQAGEGEQYIVSDVSLFNAGPRAIEVSALQFPGRETSDHLDSGPWTIDPGEWQIIETAFVPDCSDTATAPDHVEVTASAEARDDTVRVGFPPRVATFASRELLCRDRELMAPTVRLAAVDVEESSADALVATVVLKPQFGSLTVGSTAQDHVQVTGLDTTTPGLSLASDDLPLTLTSDSDTTLDVEWRITDCEIADTFSDLRLSLEWSADNGTGAESTTSSEFQPARDVLIAVTRFVADACDS